MILDLYCHKHFDENIYNVSDIKFLDDKNLLLPDGTIIKKSKKWSTTFKLCVKKLQTDGKILCHLCGTEANILRRDVEHNDTHDVVVWHFYGIKNDSYELFSKDHLIPKSLDQDFAELKIINTQFAPACESCNKLRGNTYQGMSLDDRIHEATLVKRMKWIRSSFFEDAMHILIKKNKSYKSMRSTIINAAFLKDDVRKFVLSMDLSNFILPEIQIEQKDFLIFSSDVEKDIVETFVFEKYIYKNKIMMNIVQNFQALLFQKFSERTFTF